MTARNEMGRTYIEAEFLNRINQFQQEHPVGAINMSALVVPGAGVRQALVSIYARLKDRYPFPPKAAGKHQVLSSEYLDRLDREVEAVSAEQTDIKEIARSLSVPQRWVQASQRRINSRRVKEEDPLISLVEANRLNGVGGTAVARQLDIPRSEIQWREKRLVREGKIDQMRNRRTMAQIAASDLEVKELREDQLNLTIKEIGSALTLTFAQTQTAIRRLIMQDEIKSRGNNHPTPDSGQPQK